MLAEDVLTILDTLESAGLRVWFDGGWGVDALLGEQTRDHDDVDLVVELERLDHILGALELLGFGLVEDYVPTRAVLRSQDGRQIDVHPVAFDDQGIGWQKNAAADGADCPYPPGGFGRGRVLDRSVPYLTAELQIEHHLGYEPRDRDRVDMAALASAFGLILPNPY